MVKDSARYSAIQIYKRGHTECFVKIAVRKFPTDLLFAEIAE